MELKKDGVFEMKAKDLMIGNIVYCKDKKDVVLGIADNDFYTKEHQHGICDDDLRPVPLTEEWLLKFGFYKTDSGWYKKIKNVHGAAIFSFELLFIEGDFLYAKQLPAMPVQYVHKLQNLYFAVIGEELSDTSK